MILFLAHILRGTNPLWLAASPTPAFAYLPAARDLPKFFFFHLPAMALFLLHHVRVLILFLRIALGIMEHSRNLALNCCLYQLSFPRYQFYSP